MPSTIGGQFGGLRSPTSRETGGLRAGGAYRNYENGALVSSTAAGIHSSTGQTRAAWAKTGYEQGSLGYPTSDGYPNPNGGVAEDYQGGRILVAADGTVRVLLGSNLPPVTANPDTDRDSQPDPAVNRAPRSPGPSTRGPGLPSPCGTVSCP